MTHTHVPLLYSWLNHVIQVVTVSMAALALVRLRPARRRAHGPDRRRDPAGPGLQTHSVR